MDNIVITAVGDINLSRNIRTYIKKCKNNNYNNIFRYIKNYIEESDISMGNLESVISDRIDIKKNVLKGSPNFRADTKSIEALNNSGLNTLNIANNHSNDYGNIVINDTIEILNKNNFNILGIKSKPYKLFNINGYKIIIIGISQSFSKLRTNYVDVYIYNKYTKELLNKLKSQCDLLIVSIHWGGEYKFNNNNKQKKLGIEMIKNGVDIIIGHHSHVIQNMEKINFNNRTGYIFYSLGNFIFDSHYKKKGVRDTFILKIIINPINNKLEFKYLPCIIYPKLGFIPKPRYKYFINKFPKYYTDKGESLVKDVFKYLDNCIKGGNINKNNFIDFFNKNIYLYYFLLILILITHFFKKFVY